MARAEAVDSVAESGVGGGIGAFSHPITCRMAMPRPLLAWPGLLNANMVMTPGGVPALPRQVHASQARRATHGRDFPAPSTPPPPTLCSRTAAVAPGSSSEEQSDPHGAHASIQSTELHLAGPSGPHGDPGQETDQELEIRRVAHQLRAIGDGFNAAVQLRMHVHQGQHWRDFCRGLLNLITQALGALYRLT